MSLLAQVPVRGNLDRVEWLGGPAASDKVLHVFTCEQDYSSCSMWDPSSGANAAFFLPERNLLGSASRPPSPPPPVLSEVWVRDWRPHDDPVPVELEDHFADRMRFDALPEAFRFPHGFEGELRTKVGGIPYWTGNGPQAHPGAPYRFLLQIDVFLAVPEADRGLIEIGNFCGTGTGYLFVDPDRADLPSLFAINR